MKILSPMLAVLMLVALLLPGVVAAQTAPECEFEYTVQKDDWLSKIAEKYYDDILAYMVIVEATNDQGGDEYANIDDPDLIEPGWLLCIPAYGEMAAAPEGLSPQELANATYRSEFTQDGTAPLTDGEFSEPAAPGSATETKVMILDEYTTYGQLNGQDVAIVVLVTDPGGSGTFYNLHVLVNQGGTPTDLASTSVGDRIQINSLSIEDNQIVMDMVQAGPDDPMCCPSQRVVKTYELQGDQLVETSSQVLDSEVEASSDIAGIVWNWDGFMDQSETNDIVVPNPNNYRLELLPDGQFRAKADCNLASGNYTLDGASLKFELGPVTLAECEPGSLYNEYLGLLGQVVTYVREGDNLFLNLMADAGNMNFSKLQAVTGQVVAPEPATLPENAEVEVKVMDVSLADAPATQVGGQVLFGVTQFPIDFEATYDASVIDPRNTYGLQVTIKDSQGKLLYTNTQAYSVLTRGNPTYHVEVMVEPVGN